MAGVLCELKELESFDSRSNEIAYQLNIVNDGQERITLFPVSPIVPKNAKVRKLTNSLGDLQKGHQKICRELSYLHKAIIEKAASGDTRDFQTFYKQQLIEVVDGLRPLYARTYLKIIIWKPLGKQIVKSVSTIENEARLVVIESSKQAVTLVSQWETESRDCHELEVFKEKLIRLQEIEEKINYAIANDCVQLEPGQDYNATYILRFPRGMFQSTQYSIGVEARYTKGEDKKVYVESDSKSRSVSPWPGVLSVIAILASSLGIIIKAAHNSQFRNRLTEYFDNVEEFGRGWYFLDSPLLQSAVVAFVFYNIYEYTDLGRRWNFGVNWRGALLIGFLSGFVGERIMNTLNALLGPV